MLGLGSQLQPGQPQRFAVGVGAGGELLRRPQRDRAARPRRLGLRLPAGPPPPAGVKGGATEKGAVGRQEPEGWEAARGLRSGGQGGREWGP